ncbi:hypothetical protein FRZ40_11610 [Paraburkholderia azotifigens]|uniref:Uncharacterized protein n=1 Tax=Paraburkholderia azotifigens TaxID=2057004 RepID=A0A5C6VU61_9BURK|nr:hypothetical protein FRZ40_11610 [Paraburkholderia azotifigens]
MSCATPILPSSPLGHVPEMPGHVAEIAGHDPETAGHVRPKYAPISLSLTSKGSMSGLWLLRLGVDSAI